MVWLIVAATTATTEVAENTKEDKIAKSTPKGQSNGSDTMLEILNNCIVFL